jgi:hypothetical protein
MYALGRNDQQTVSLVEPALAKQSNNPREARVCNPDFVPQVGAPGDVHRT